MFHVKISMMFFFLKLKKRDDGRTAYKPSRCRGREKFGSLHVEEELRRINMVDGECVGAQALWLGDLLMSCQKQNKKKLLWLSSATSPVCLLQWILCMGHVFSSKIFIF